jgi:transposase
MGYSSVEERWSIVAAWKQAGSLVAVSKMLGLSLRMVKRWVERYNATGRVDDAPRSGRKPLLSSAAARQARLLLTSKGNGGAKSVAKLLYMSGHVNMLVDRKTVTRAYSKLTKEMGITYRVKTGKPGKELTAATVQKRLAFCRANQTRSWSNVLFTDRKKFAFYYPGEKVQAVQYLEKGQRHEAYRVNHAQVVNVYAGISRFGVTKLHVVSGSSGQKASYKTKKGTVAKNITAMEYKDVVMSTLLPEGRRIFTAQGISSWVLQQDNDPSHKDAVKLVEDWNAKHASSVSVLQPWPPNSPDLNPIENLWAWMDRKLDAMGCSTFQEYKAAVHSVAKSVPPRMSFNLITSMPARIAECMRLGGKITGY